jgi:hypothetical protein
MRLCLSLLRTRYAEVFTRWVVPESLVLSVRPDMGA